VTAKIAAVILAAGESTRMAPRNKLLELLDGKAIVTHATEAAIASGADPVVVITRFAAPRVAEAVRHKKVVLALNPAFEQGLSASLGAGVAALPSDIEGALICLGDMPNVGASVLRALMAAFSGSSKICVPAHHGRRGNPVLWGRDYFAEMMQLAGDVGAKGLLMRHADHIVEVEVGSDGIFEDVDTACDLTRLTSSRRTPE
jgi:molybdenum cofactor cytidylyltransferase